MSIGFHNDGSSSAPRSQGYGQRMPKSSGLLRNMFSGAFWFKMGDKAVLILIISGLIALGFGLLFNRSSSEAGWLGTTSSLGAQGNPVVRKETNALLDLIGFRYRSPYQSPYQSPRQTEDVTVERR